MPELQWQYGYPLVMVGMLVVAVGLLGLFYKKEWL
jgi:Mg2+ and Co2+ transporter CorA